MKPNWRWWFLLLVPGLFLVFLSFRRVPLDAMGAWLGDFGVTGMLLMLVFEVPAWILMGERWRYFCRESGWTIELPTASAARLAGFAWSYITPGPHLGGEPVQILYLRNRGYPTSRMLASLVRDRGYELISGLLTTSLLLLIPGTDQRSGYRSLLAIAVLGAGLTLISLSPEMFRAFAALIVRFTGFRRRRAVYTLLLSVFRPPEARKRSLPVRIVLMLSLLTAPLLIITEIVLFFSLSGASIGWRGAFLLAAVSRVSHYAPVPGAVGVYDAGIIAAAAWLQLDLGTAAAYVLMTRLRDFLQVSGGLVISGRWKRTQHAE